MLLDIPQTDYHQYLEDGGEMGKLTRSFDWESSVLGSPENWSVSLLTTLSILLQSKFPMFLWWGPELIQFYNDAYRPSFGSEGKHPTALGQRAEECWPEIWHIIKPLIDQVMLTGESAWSENQLIPIYRNNRMEDVYWTFSYSRVKDDARSAGGVLVICNETTSTVRALNTLKEAKLEVEYAHKESESQRDRLKRFLMQAPAGICILDGPDLVFELVNPSYQQLFPGRDLLGKPVLQALPEISGQPVWNILQAVYHTGQTFEGNELLVPFIDADEGQLKDRYFNFIYQARYDAYGVVDGILVFVFEVTEMVAFRKKLESAEDKLKSALVAAELGTFDMNLEKGTMEWDDRCRTLFGISHKDVVTYEKDFVNGLHPDDRERIVTTIEKVLINSIGHGDYDVEYRTIGAEDQKLRWVRAKGKAYFDENDKPMRFVGSVLDISEQKTDELRKNDFIGMVSHELKTPLTSLNAYIQMLHARAKDNEDSFSAGALEKVISQVKKMSVLINGFLNVSRLESGKIHLKRENFDLNILVEETINETQWTISTHQFSFTPFASMGIHADRDKIGSVISNLLTNAVKYSPNARLIEVECAVADGMAMVSVRDEGMGISQQDIEHLFDRYYRVESNHTKHISGFGIGLYLSAEIIRIHNGKIWVESEMGKGSTFVFSIPLA